MQWCGLRWSCWQVLCCCVLQVLLGTTVFMSSAAAAPRPATLLVVGDSLSAGYGIDVKQGWVALLAQRLDAQGYGYRVINASISGETTTGGNARLPGLLATHQPDIVIIELGANDGLRGLPVKQMRRNLEAMIAGSKNQGARVILLGMQLPDNYGPAYTRSFASVFAELAKQYRLPWTPFFLDGVSENPALMQADNLHPNERAQTRLLENAWSVLFPMIKK